MNKQTLFCLLPLLILMQAEEKGAGEGGENMAALRNQNGDLVADKALPGEPKKAAKLSTLGDPVFEVVTRAGTISGYKAAKSSVLSATVAFADFLTVHGGKLRARIVRYQTGETIDANGRKVGKGTMDLTFSPDYARGGQQLDMAIGDGQQWTAWKQQIIGEYVAWRDAQGIPKPLLVETQTGRGLEID